MIIELTPQEVMVMHKALNTHMYIVERVINGDEVLNEETLKTAIDSILIMKDIKLKLDNND